MEPFSVHILGCGSARPTYRHKPACQVVSLRGKLFMIDCGEGAQMAFNRQGLNLSRLGCIFISHNHGDHVFGLPGLISTMALLGRTAELHIYGPKEVKAFIDMVEQLYCEGIDYKITFHAVDTKSHQIVFEDRSIKVWSIPLEHRIPACGYMFCEKAGLPHIKREMIDAYNIPVCQINNIKAGAGWTAEDGQVLTHEMLTVPAAPTRSFAYCSDTIYKPGLSSLIKGADLLFHEATYPEKLLYRAKQTYHSTARQAAEAAKNAQVKKLCIGHFSARIYDEVSLLKEAQDVFANTILANEGLTIEL
ncbi:MAG: ribonuclease Z [Bacteroidaceae bacterium]|nr:ribonuclease Z [Bacteroidaceae bacterium]